jgi:hypothetical protein
MAVLEILKARVEEQTRLMQLALAFGCRDNSAETINAANYESPVSINFLALTKIQTVPIV